MHDHVGRAVSEARCRRGSLDQPLEEVVRRHRPGDRVALHHVAAELGELVDDLGGLGTLGDDPQVEAAPEATIAVDQRAARLGRSVSP